MSKELAVIDSVRGTALENYADRSVVRELMNRLMAFHPAHTDVGEQGMLMAAQIAILMGASPLPGTNEIHIWLDKGKPKVEAGINYWQRRGDQKGGVLWDIEPRPMSESEMEMYQIAKGSHYAAICRGIRIMDIAPLRELGLPINQIMKMKGVVGIGVAAKTEYAKNGRPPVWTAIKRAKTDFFKMAFPFIPGEVIEPGAGMVRNESGQIEPDYTNPHWGNELGWDAQEEPDEPSEFVQYMTDLSGDELNEILFGDGESGNAPIEGSFTEDQEPKKVKKQQPKKETAVTDEQRKPSDAMLKKLWASGNAFYGTEWEAKRAELVKAVTKGRTDSSKHLTFDECKKLIDGIEENANKPGLFDEA